MPRLLRPRLETSTHQQHYNLRRVAYFLRLSVLKPFARYYSSGRFLRGWCRVSLLGRSS